MSLSYSSSSSSSSSSFSSSEETSSDDESWEQKYRVASAASLVEAADRLFALGYGRDAEQRYSYAIGQYPAHMSPIFHVHTNATRLDLCPSPDNYCYRSYYYLDVGDHVKSERDARSALRQDPSSGLAQFIMAKCDIIQGRYESAWERMHHLQQHQDLGTRSIIRLEMKQLDRLKGLVSRVNQSFLSRDWVKVYHYARLILTSSPAMTRLRVLMTKAVTGMESMPGYREKRDMMQSVRRALDHLIAGKDYCNILSIDTHRLDPEEVTEDHVKDGYAKSFCRLAVQSGSSDQDLKDMDDAYHFLMDERRRSLLLEWRCDPDNFDPNDLMCYTIRE